MYWSQKAEQSIDFHHIGQKEQAINHDVNLFGWLQFLEMYLEEK